MSEFTAQHTRGVEVLVDRLEHKRRECHNCGFEDSILHSEWNAHVETDENSEHIRYRLVCPDCNTEQLVDLDL